eukprot:CAMPEP_0172555054 /NCGR_PEP_ID=MMETSP1067-20121228/57765_1 /TAXON_ID=265564 ORGANISM="Thalassiosira punctigera, Strain Tpunct2005C2" /NCGR_SAMPLE_ID=MMETSP1067 /ASSEMBLY_ACC=CAM_ASM_000444 /LENGTH=273 /DNA_ID=CAMNT_0013343557 /DNA_START=196 /DNA_END=1017 /DNA_ORIENTATION=-
MADNSFVLLSVLIICAISRGYAFQTSQMLPLRVDPILKGEICQRLGLKQRITNAANNDGSSSYSLSIGSGPNMGYALTDEHEVLCPISGAHQGVLCAALLSQPVDNENADSVANHHELVSQAILSGSLAASVRSRCGHGDGAYYLPSVITLVESLMADELRSMDLGFGEKVFNSAGLETNEILMDWGSHDDVALFDEEDDGRRVMLYSCNVVSDHNSAMSDVYVLPRERAGKVWRFSVEFKVAAINLRQIPCFGDRDSTTPLRPDVWLKDDSY